MSNDTICRTTSAILRVRAIGRLACRPSRPQLN